MRGFGSSDLTRFLLGLQATSASFRYSEFTRSWNTTTFELLAGVAYFGDAQLKSVEVNDIPEPVPAVLITCGLLLMLLLRHGRVANR